MSLSRFLLLGLFSASVATMAVGSQASAQQQQLEGQVLGAGSPNSLLQRQMRPSSPAMRGNG